MPTRKIADLPRVCNDQEHNVPAYQVFEDGVWEHTCPSCGKVTVFTVNKPKFSESVRPEPVTRGRCSVCYAYPVSTQRVA